MQLLSGLGEPAGGALIAPDLIHDAEVKQLPGVGHRFAVKIKLGGVRAAKSGLLGIAIETGVDIDRELGQRRGGGEDGFEHRVDYGSVFGALVRRPNIAKIAFEHIGDAIRVHLENIRRSAHVEFEFSRLRATQSNLLRGFIERAAGIDWQPGLPARRVDRSDKDFWDEADVTHITGRAVGDGVLEHLALVVPVIDDHAELRCLWAAKIGITGKVAKCAIVLEHQPVHRRGRRKRRRSR